MRKHEAHETCQSFPRIPKQNISHLFLFHLAFLSLGMPAETARFIVVSARGFDKFEAELKLLRGEVSSEVKLCVPDAVVAVVLQCVGEEARREVLVIQGVQVVD